MDWGRKSKTFAETKTRHEHKVNKAGVIRFCFENLLSCYIVPSI